MQHVAQELTNTYLDNLIEENGSKITEIRVFTRLFNVTHPRSSSLMSKIMKQLLYQKKNSTDTRGAYKSHQRMGYDVECSRSQAGRIYKIFESLGYMTPWIDNIYGSDTTFYDIDKDKLTNDLYVHQEAIDQHTAQREAWKRLKSERRKGKPKCTESKQHVTIQQHACNDSVALTNSTTNSLTKPDDNFISEGSIQNKDIHIPKDVRVLLENKRRLVMERHSPDVQACFDMVCDGVQSDEWQQSRYDLFVARYEEQPIPPTVFYPYLKNYIRTAWVKWRQCEDQTNWKPYTQMDNGKGEPATDSHTNQHAFLSPDENVPPRVADDNRSDMWKREPTLDEISIKAEYERSQTETIHF